MGSFERFLLGLVVGSSLILVGATIILFLKKEMEANIELVPKYNIDSKGLSTVLYLPVSNTE